MQFADIRSENNTTEINNTVTKKLIMGITLTLILNPTIADNQRGLKLAQKPVNIAVLAGINQYDARSGLRSLSYALNDTNQLASTLRNQGYDVHILSNHQATKHHLLKTVRDTASLVADTDGTFIFAFSGHGFAGQETSGKRNNYLATHGTVLNQLHQSALSMQELISTVRQSKVKRTALFIDACRDQPGLSGSRSITQQSFVQQHSQGLNTLYSTEFSQISWESSKLKRGVFSYFLQQGLAGAAKRGDGVISFDSLKYYVQEKVPVWTLQHLKQLQTPYAEGASYGDLMLAPKRHQAQPIARPSRPQQPVQQPTIPRPNNTPRVNQPPVHQPITSGQYSDTGRGIIQDTKNRLMWKKCSEGQKGKNCSGTATPYTWSDAQQLRGSSFAGYNDWRLPTRTELLSLVLCSNGVIQKGASDTCKGNDKKGGSYKKPTINPVFYNTVGGPSSNGHLYAHRSGNDTGVSFKNGNEQPIKLGSKMHIRLVRDTK